MSLTEFCIVGAVIAAGTSIAAPIAIRAKETYVLKSAARDVASKMHAARIAAITGNGDCRLRVASSDSYVLECQRGAWELMETVQLPRGITITANARPEFHRRGNVSPTATVSLTNAAGRSARVIVNVNGRVRIE